MKRAASLARVSSQSQGKANRTYADRFGFEIGGEFVDQIMIEWQKSAPACYEHRRHGDLTGGHMSDINTTHKMCLDCWVFYPTTEKYFFKSTRNQEYRHLHEIRQERIKI